MSAPRYQVGDCHVGDCRRPADHAGRHGEPTPLECATLRPPPAPEADDPFDGDEWADIERAYRARLRT